MALGYGYPSTAVSLALVDSKRPISEQVCRPRANQSGPSDRLNELRCSNTTRYKLHGRPLGGAHARAPPRDIRAISRRQPYRAQTQQTQIAPNTKKHQLHFSLFTWNKQTLDPTLITIVVVKEQFRNLRCQLKMKEKLNSYLPNGCQVEDSNPVTT